jgi:hypothetical protein
MRTGAKTSLSLRERAIAFAILILILLFAAWFVGNVTRRLDTQSRSCTSGDCAKAGD